MQHSYSTFRSVPSQRTSDLYNAYYDRVECFGSVAKQLCCNGRIYSVYILDLMFFNQTNKLAISKCTTIIQVAFKTKEYKPKITKIVFNIFKRSICLRFLRRKISIILIRFHLKYTSILPHNLAYRTQIRLHTDILYDN